MIQADRLLSDGNSRRICQRCRQKACSGAKSIQSKKEFFFYGTVGRCNQSKLSLKQALELFFQFLHTILTVHAACFLVGVSKPTVVDSWHSCRDTVRKSLESEPKFVGYDDVTVQIGEAKIAGSAKYLKGRRLSGDREESNDTEETDLPLWHEAEPQPDDGGTVEAKDDDYVTFVEDHAKYKQAVGISNGLGKVKFERVPNRSTHTLLAIEQKYVLSGSVIHADGRRGYSLLTNHGNSHSVVIYEQNYVDPNTGTHTQTIEGSGSRFEPIGDALAKTKGTYILIWMVSSGVHNIERNEIVWIYWISSYQMLNV